MREVKEETGIVILPEEVELIDDSGRGTAEKTLRETGEQVICEMQFNVYKVVLNQTANEIRVSLHDDLMKYQWIDLDDLKNLKLTPPSVELFKRLGYLV